MVFRPSSKFDKIGYLYIKYRYFNNMVVIKKVLIIQFLPLRILLFSVKFKRYLVKYYHII